MVVGGDGGEAERPLRLGRRVGAVEGIIVALSTAVKATHCVHDPQGVLSTMRAVVLRDREGGFWGGRRHRLGQSVNPTSQLSGFAEHVVNVVW